MSQGIAEAKYTKEIEMLKREILSLQEAQARDAAALVELRAQLAVAVELLEEVVNGGCVSYRCRMDAVAREALAKIRGEDS